MHLFMLSQLTSFISYSCHHKFFIVIILLMAEELKLRYLEYELSKSIIRKISVFLLSNLRREFEWT